MYATVQLMSGVIHQLYLHDTTSVLDLKYTVSSMLDLNDRLVVLHYRTEDGEFPKADTSNLVEDGDHFYVLVKDPPPPPTTVYLDFTGAGYILSKESGEVVLDFTQPIDLSLVPESLILITRALEDDSCEYMREVLHDDLPNRFDVFSRYYDIFMAPHIAERVLVTIFN
jgi:hypothetical protein